MRRLMWIMAALLIVGSVVIPASAQDALTQTFTSSDGAFSFRYPEGWQFSQSKTSEAVGLTDNRLLTAVVNYPAFEPNGPLLTPERYLEQTIIDLGQGTLIDPEVQSIEIGGRQAARLDAKSPAFGTLLAVTVAFPEHLAAFAFAGDDASIRQAEPTLLALVASFSVSNKTEAPARGRGGVLTGRDEAPMRTVTASDGAFSIQYPAGWDAKPSLSGMVTVSDGADLVFIGAYPGGDATSEAPRDYLGGLLADGTFTSFEINGYPATRIDNSKVLKGGTAFLIEIDGVYAYLNWLSTPEKIKANDAILMAMAASLQTNVDADAALTQTFTAPGGAFSFRYPDGWTLDVREVGLLHFGDSTNDVQGEIKFSNDGKNAKQTVSNLMVMAGVSPDMVSEVQLGKHTAARSSANAGDFTGAFFAVDLDGGGVMLMTANGPSATFEQEELLLLAILTSVQTHGEPGGSAVETAVFAGTGALTQSYVAEDESFSFNYPDDWQVTLGSEGVNFTNADESMRGIIEYELSSQPARQLVAELLKQAGLPTDTTSYEHKGRTVVTAAASNGALSLEMYGIDFDAQHVFVLTVLADTTTMTAAHDQIVAVVESFREDARAPLMAFAPSGAIAPASALTESYAAANGAFAFRYPAGWTFEATGSEFDVDFESQMITGRLSYGPLGTTATAYIAAKVANLGVPASAVRSFELNGRRAAEVTVPDSGGAFAGRYIAVEYEDGTLLFVGAAGLMRAFDEANPLLFALIASFEPAGSGDAASTAEATVVSGLCTVSASSTTNLRGGPGTTFAKTGTLAVGVTQAVTGQASGADGKVWYQLEGGNWVRSDVVSAGGDCASVPTVTP